MGDPFLNYVALSILIFVVVVIFYGIIAIHDIPHIIAKSRDHPHQDAIHAAGWVSLFTLHAIWPFLWIWAMAYRPERGWGFGRAGPTTSDHSAIFTEEIADLRKRVAILEIGANEALQKRDPGLTREPDLQMKPNPEGTSGTGSS
jgi:hypothetical protein